MGRDHLLDQLLSVSHLTTRQLIEQIEQGPLTRQANKSYDDKFPLLHVILKERANYWK